MQRQSRLVAGPRLVVSASLAEQPREEIQAARLDQDIPMLTGQRQRGVEMPHRVRRQALLRSDRSSRDMRLRSEMRKPRSRLERGTEPLIRPLKVASAVADPPEQLEKAGFGAPIS